jgi:excisionase family DNA binding protein
MRPVVEQTVLPPGGGSTLAEVSTALTNARTVSLVVTDGSQVELPDEVVAVLRSVVSAMAEGQAITVAPRAQVLTTQEAADFLGVSRPTLVRLLSDGKIPFTRPSRHRRVRLSDLVEYQKRSREERREILSQMSREAAADGHPAGDGFETTR